MSWFKALLAYIAVNAPMLVFGDRVEVYFGVSVDWNGKFNCLGRFHGPEKHQPLSLKQIKIFGEEINETARNPEHDPPFANAFEQMGAWALGLLT